MSTVSKLTGLREPDLRHDECVTIASGTQAIVPAFREVWRFRELLFFFAWRDIKVRYKQTALGIAWAVLQPLAIALAVAVFLGRYVNPVSDGLPYAVFVYAAMLPWQFFAHVVTESSNSMVANERLVTKVYFPRLLVPISSVIGGLLDFSLSFVILMLFLGWYRIAPSIAVFTLPLWIALAGVAACGVGLWLAALNVQYRDVRYTLALLVQAWFFLTPIAYSSTVVTPAWRRWYALNPLVAAVDGFRWALLPRANRVPAEVVIIGAVSALFLLVTGVAYFRRMEATFADII